MEISQGNFWSLTSPYKYSMMTVVIMLRPLINKLRFNYFIASHTLEYTNIYLKTIYRIYLNHDKVIHYRNGHPVFSLSTPALYSKPMANFLAQGLFRVIQNKNIPNLMSFAVNDECDANCEHCSFYEGVHEKNKKVVTLDQARKIIKSAQELGVSVITIVGGEPLMRQDLPEIIASVDKNTSCVILFTNGCFLSQRVAELRKNGLDGVYVSIDSADPSQHDSFRGRKGLFKKAIDGINKTKKCGLSVGISTTITKDGFKKGNLDRIIELGKEIGIHEVLVFDAIPSGRYKKRKDLIDDQNWIEQMIHSVKKYNQDESYPGVLVYAYAASHRSVGCSGGTSYCYISPYGEMMPCDFNHRSFGNVLDEPFYKIWERMTSQEPFCSAKWGGCRIKDKKK